MQTVKTFIKTVLHPFVCGRSSKAQTFFESFDEFLQIRPLSDARKKSFLCMVRTLQRYELYIQKPISFDNFTPEMIRGLSGFLKNEHEFYQGHPELYRLKPTRYPPKPRGQNTINDILTKLRTFFLWAVDNDKTTNNPFKKCTIGECVYGTPFYISIDERNRLYNTDLTNCPELEIQRDIFVFQCLIGCRISDLYKLSKHNVINGAVEYIAQKTKGRRPVTLRVPLNTAAKEILQKYINYNGVFLLPFATDRKYNKAIKDAFAMAGLTRMVTTLDPLTRECLLRPLNEVATSQLARRCFVGNLYKKVKDPILVGTLSGHKEGSRAFARYREIDEATKNELVKMLE